MSAGDQVQRQTGEERAVFAELARVVGDASRRVVRYGARSQC
jgi:hypothetical protein